MKYYDYTSFKKIDFKMGYFKESSKLKINNSVDSIIYKFDDKIEINHNVRVNYYAGAFSTFHTGHLNCIRYVYDNEIKIDDNFIIVISPSHTDYLIYKYSTEHNISNKDRYERIKKSCLSSLDENILSKVIIDLSPMLNYYSDQNFPNLIMDFCHSLNIELSNTHSIICGKDKNWSNELTLHTGLKIYYLDRFDYSSKDEINKLDFFKPKKLYLRCHFESEYLLFKEYFASNYSDIEPFYMADELEIAKGIALKNNIKYTICKDYESFLEYIPYHRSYINPLENSYNEKPILPMSVDKILDSDVYSGGTKNQFIKENINFYSVLNFEGMNDSIELLDIDDFYLDDFHYPKYDISSKCSMKPFDIKSLKLFDEFKLKLKELKNEN